MRLFSIGPAALRRYSSICLLVSRSIPSSPFARVVLVVADCVQLVIDVRRSGRLCHPRLGHVKASAWRDGSGCAEQFVRVRHAHTPHSARAGLVVAHAPERWRVKMNRRCRRVSVPGWRTPWMSDASKSNRPPAACSVVLSRTQPSSSTGTSPRAGLRRTRRLLPTTCRGRGSPCSVPRPSR